MRLQRSWIHHVPPFFCGEIGLKKMAVKVYSKIFLVGNGYRHYQKKVKEVIEKTLQGKPENATHSSCRSLGQVCRVSHSAVQRVWSANNLKPHLVRTFKLSRDPQQRIRRGVFQSVEGLKQAIYDYIKHNNRNPRPFVWTKKADEIITSVNRCKAMLETLH